MFPVGMNAWAENMITNGDFELGNEGFLTDYVNAVDIFPAQYYAIASDPSTVHGSGISYGDHTTGSGLMMIVNGATTPNQRVWAQTVAVSPNSNCSLSGWVSTWTPGGGTPAILEFTVNGDVVATVTAPATEGVWESFGVDWSSGSATTAEIVIIDQNLAYVGNDFALDDLTMSVQAGSCVGSIETSTIGASPVHGYSGLLKHFTLLGLPLGILILVEICRRKRQEFNPMSKR
jgi:hypothetical protein